MLNRDKLFIGGQWVAPAASESIDVHHAGNGEVMGHVPAGGEKDAEAAELAKLYMLTAPNYAAVMESFLQTLKSVLLLPVGALLYLPFQELYKLFLKVPMLPNHLPLARLLFLNVAKPADIFLYTPYCSSLLFLPPLCLLQFPI